MKMIIHIKNIKNIVIDLMIKEKKDMNCNICVRNENEILFINIFEKIRSMYK